MKCQRCGNDAFMDMGKVLTKATGSDAIVTLTKKGRVDTVSATVCVSCARMLRRLGWQ